jgi:Effector-associated domain 11
MIVPHRFIDELTETQVFRILKMLGEWTKNNRKGGLNLPRYPIDLTGAPADLNIARLLLHAAAEENNTLNVVFRKFLFTEQGNLRNEKETNPQSLPDTKGWTLYAAWILIYLNNELSIEFKNQMWQVECKSERMLGISEIRDLIQIVRMDASKISAKLIIMGGNVGKIVMGDEINNITEVQKDKIYKSVEENKIKTLIIKGETKEAINTLILMHSNSTENSKTAILLKSRYENNQKDYGLGARSQEDYRTEIQRINEAILNFIEEE